MVYHIRALTTDLNSGSVGSLCRKTRRTGVWLAFSLNSALLDHILVGIQNLPSDQCDDCVIFKITLSPSERRMSLEVVIIASDVRPLNTGFNLEMDGCMDRCASAGVQSVICTPLLLEEMERRGLRELVFGSQQTLVS